MECSSTIKQIAGFLGVYEDTRLRMVGRSEVKPFRIERRSPGGDRSAGL
jgi:hypothetical protein